MKTKKRFFGILLSLVLVLGLFPGMSLTALAADEVSENISLVASPSANLKTISGTHYSVSCGYMCANDSGMQVCKSGALTINARKGETITKVVLTYSWGNNKSSLSASAGTFDGNATISDINAQQVTISSSNTAGVKISAVRVYFEGSLSNPTVTLTGGANAKSSGGLLKQSYLPGAMDTVTYTALTGAAFPEFETFTQNGVTVERTSDTVVTISGTPTANTEITVPDAESSSKMVTWGSSIINDSGRNGLEYQIRRNNSYSDTANGITLTKSGSGYASLSNGNWMTSGDVTLNFTTATGKFTSIEIETSQIYDGGNWTKDGNTLKWNGTPSNSVSLSGSGLYLEGVSSINFVIEMPTVSVTITPGSNMTKTTDSGDAEQTGLTGAMADVVYTAVDGYYFPTNYSVAEVSGIKVTRDSYTQITVSGTPTADAAIALTAPTAKTTPDAPTAAATDCTTTDNNDGKLTGVTTEMEYKKSDAENWTAGTGSDITGLVPGTYYVRVKATETTNASTNQELTIKGFISYTVTFKVVNGKWNEGEGDAATADKTVTLTGYEGDTLKLAANQIPAVGDKPGTNYRVGSWNVTPSANTAITADTTYIYTYAQKDTISRTVTFKVVNGSWNDETATDKTVTLTGYEGDTLKLAANQIPAVGDKPGTNYKAGSWNVTPSANTAITADMTYTYTYAQKDTISQTVTFKVVNGKWDDETTADKTVTLTGYEGDTLKLAANQIPAVGSKPNDTYKAGSWDVMPNTDTAITEATTYTYTYVAKEASVVTKAPEAKILTYNGSAQALVTAGEATGGTMQYAIGDANGASQPYTTSIPTATDARTYYVWYKVVGDSNHLDSNIGCVTVTIATADSSDSGSGSTSSGSSDSGSGSTSSGSTDSGSGSTSSGSTDSGSGSSSSSGSSDSGNTSGGTSSGSSDNTNTNTDTSAKIPYDSVPISTGSVNDITGTASATAESNPFGTKIENNSNLTTLLSLTDAEVAQGVNVWLDIQDMSASVSQTDKTLIQNTSGDYTVGLYLDINLFKKVGSNDATKVTETNGKVKASIVIPESLWKSGRTFEIIRVHDGVATAIAGTYDENTHVFTFETDKFSTYALAYKDPASSSNSGTTSNSSSSNGSNSIQATAPKTGDSNDIRVWYLLLMASLGGLGFIGYSKKKEK